MHHRLSTAKKPIGPIVLHAGPHGPLAPTKRSGVRG